MGSREPHDTHLPGIPGRRKRRGHACTVCAHAHNCGPAPPIAYSRVCASVSAACLLPHCKVFCTYATQQWSSACCVSVPHNSGGTPEANCLWMYSRRGVTLYSLVTCCLPHWQPFTI